MMIITVKTNNEVTKNLTFYSKFSFTAYKRQLFISWRRVLNHRKCITVNKHFKLHAK